MEDNVKLIEKILEEATDYGKTSIELIKLKTLDKTSDVVSSITTHYIVFFIIGIFVLFFNMALAFWLGEILGEISYGFFVVAAFYGVIGLLIHFFMHKWIKKGICNSIIKLLLN